MLNKSKISRIVNLLIFLISLFQSQILTAQSKTITEFKFLAKPDTILKNKNEGKVYISTDTSSKVYEWIVPNPDSELLDRYFNEYISKLKNDGVKIGNFSIQNTPRKWNEVKVFNEQYYLYAPSDWMYNTGYYISDSIIYIAESDPGDLYVILEESVNKENTNFKVINYGGEILNIKISPINLNLGIYVWEFTDKENKVVRKNLMQNSLYSKKLPMIVSDCGENKCHIEFEFDKTDFDELD